MKLKINTMDKALLETRPKGLTHSQDATLTNKMDTASDEIGVGTTSKSSHSQTHCLQVHKSRTAEDPPNQRKPTASFSTNSAVCVVTVSCCICGEDWEDLANAPITQTMPCEAEQVGDHSGVKEQLRPRPPREVTASSGVEGLRCCGSGCGRVVCGLCAEELILVDPNRPVSYSCPFCGGSMVRAKNMDS